MLARMEEANPGNETQASTWPKPGERSTSDPGLDQGALQRKVLGAIRHHSAYPKTRALIELGMWLAVMAEVLVALSAKYGAQNYTPVFQMFIAVVATIAIGNALLAVFDMADLAIRNHQRAEDNR